MDHGDLLRECHVVTYCTPSRHRSVSCWLDYNALYRFKLLRGLTILRCRRCRLLGRRHQPKAPPTRTSFAWMPITFVATSANLAEGDPIEPISDSASRERNRRRRSRRREMRRHRSRSRSRHRRPLNRLGPLTSTEHRGAPSSSEGYASMPSVRTAQTPLMLGAR